MEIAHAHMSINELNHILGKDREPLTAITYYDPNQTPHPYTPASIGRFNVEGRILNILGVDPDQIATLTPEQVRIIINDGLEGSTALQRAFLPYFDSRRFGLNHRNGPEVAMILQNPNNALARGGREITTLAEIVSHYSTDLMKTIPAASGTEGMLYADNVYATKLQMAGVAYFQSPPIHHKDGGIKSMANFTAQAVMREVTQDLPLHIQDLACWAANELQIANDDGHIHTTVRDALRNENIEVDSNLYFLPNLLDLDGQPLTMAYLREYQLKAWEIPLTAVAIMKNRQRFFGLVSDIHHEHQEIRKAHQDNQTS